MCNPAQSRMDLRGGEIGQEEAWEEEEEEEEEGRQEVADGFQSAHPFAADAGHAARAGVLAATPNPRRLHAVPCEPHGDQRGPDGWVFRC